MRYPWLGTGVLLAGLSVSTAVAQNAPPAGGQTPPPNGEYITKEQFEKAIKEMAEKFQEQSAQDRKAWQEKVSSLETQLKDSKLSKEDRAAQEKERQEELADLEKMIKANASKVDALHPGFRSLVIAGDASVGFNAAKGSNSSFNAGFSPVFLYHLDDSILFEVALDMGLGNADENSDGGTSLDLTIADFTYAVCDNLIVGGGVFVTPFGVYHNHYDPSWINKLPDDPLPFGDRGFTPGSMLGIFVRGAVPVGDAKITYDAYVINGPRLVANDPAATNGTLLFNGYDDNNNGKSFGGRLGFLPVPWLETGYSVMYGTVTPASPISTGPATSPMGVNSANALLQAFDLEIKRDVDFLCGTVDFHAELAWSHVDSVTYPPLYDGTPTLLFPAATYTVNRSGGYLQVAYRPTVGNKIVDRLEGVVRYDWLKYPVNTPGGDSEQRWTIGVDYWIRSNVVFKVAYEFDHRNGDSNVNAFLMQLGVGF